MVWRLLFLISAFAIFLLLFYFVGSRIFQKKRQLDNRIFRIIGIKQQFAEVVTEEDQTEDKRLFRLPRILLHAIAKQFKGKSFLTGWEKKLEQANIPFTAEEYFVIRLLAGAVVVVLIRFTSLGQYRLFPIVSFFLGYWLPERVVKYKREKRLRQFSVQLPAALGTMANSMRAGFSFLQSLKMVGQEMPDPIGMEFNKTLRELNLNIPVEDAFRHLLDRLPNRDLELVVSALLIQRTTGGNLAELFESMQETLQERVRIKEELHTLTAQGRLSAWIITLLPLVLVFLIRLMSPDYFSPMLTNPIGWVFIGFGIVSGAMGWFAIRKIVRIEV